jgi:hypothetical protein
MESPVHDSFLNKSNKSIANLPKKAKSLCFRHLGVLLDVPIEIAIADILDDIVVMTAFHYVENLDNVIGLEKLQDLYF